MSKSRKECFKCKAVLPLSEFYKHPMMADGHLGKCKACTKRDVIANRTAKVAYYRTYDRKRHKEVAERREAHRQRSREFGKKHPEKRRAHTAVHNALRDGKLKRQPCSKCGARTAQAHHEDYSRPLDVTWLCFECHRKEHGRWVAPF